MKIPTNGKYQQYKTIKNIIPETIMISLSNVCDLDYDNLSLCTYVGSPLCQDPTQILYAPIYNESVVHKLVFLTRKQFFVSLLKIIVEISFVNNTLYNTNKHISETELPNININIQKHNIYT